VRTSPTPLDCTVDQQGDWPHGAFAAVPNHEPDSWVLTVEVWPAYPKHSFRSDGLSAVLPALGCICLVAGVASPH
jgi:hypothetical protein